MSDLGPGVIGVVMALAFGVIFTGVALTILWQTWSTTHRTRTWPRATAQVVSVAQERRTRGTGSDRRVRYVLVAHYRYRHPVTGAVVEGTSDVPSQATISQDAPVEVAYHPEDAGRSFIPGSGSLVGPSCLTVFLLPFLAIGIGGFVVCIWLLTDAGGWP